MDPDFVIEVASELGEEASEIHRTIFSKAPYISMRQKRYVLIGPYAPENKHFSGRQLPAGLQPISDELKMLGVRLHYGVLNHATTILLETSSLSKQRNQIKNELWDWFKIDSIHAKEAGEDKLFFGYAAGMLIEKLLPFFNHRKGLVHCHSLGSAACLLYLKAKRLKLATVYTSYSTIMGSALKEIGTNIIENNFDADKESYRHNLEFLHQLEREASRNADACLAVNELSAKEAMNVLGAKVSTITHGIDAKTIPSFDEINIHHGIARENLKEFIKIHFFPYYLFDESKARYLFVSGKDIKGIENTIAALASLNNAFKNSKKTLIAFLFAPSFSKGIQLSFRQTKEKYERLRSFVREGMSELEKEIIDERIKRNLSSKLFNDFLEAVQGMNFEKKGTPSLLTHDISYEEDNKILKLLRKHGLQNKEKDRVKVILYPVKPAQDDGILNLSLKDAVLACDLALFPALSGSLSQDVLEALAMGVPSLTTELSFSKQENNSNLCILPSMKGFQSSLYKIIFDFMNSSEEGLAQKRLEAYKTAMSYDWSRRIEEYSKLYREASGKAF